MIEGLMGLSRLRARWGDWARTASGRRVGKVGRIAFVGAIVVVLLFRLGHVGWSEIAEALPVTPWFYVTWLAMYFVMPFTDAVIYRMIWGIPLIRSMPVYLRKRVYSTDVLAYSGELYLYFWAKRWRRGSGTALMRTIRDVTLLSGFSAVFVSLSLLAVFLLSGMLPIAQFPRHRWIVALSVSAVVLIGLVLAAMRFRRHFFSLTGRHALVTVGGHVTRILVFYSLQVLQWAVVIPDVALRDWITLLAANILVNQIPFVPSKDLIFLGVGIEMARWTGVGPASIAALLLAKSILDKTANIAFYTYTTIRRPSSPVFEQDAEDMSSLPEEAHELLHR